MVINREYRTMPLLAPAAANKRFDTDFYVEGYATTFDDPYVLYECDGIQYKEIIDRHQGRIFLVERPGPGITLRIELLVEGPDHGQA